MITLLASSLQPTLSPQTITWSAHILRSFSLSLACMRASRPPSGLSMFPEIGAARTFQFSFNILACLLNLDLVVEPNWHSNLPSPQTQSHFASATSGVGSWGKGLMKYVWTIKICFLHILWCISNLILIYKSNPLAKTHNGCQVRKVSSGTMDNWKFTRTKRWPLFYVEAGAHLIYSRVWLMMLENDNG